MKVRCKFRCTSVTLKENNVADVQLNAIASKDTPENEAFWRWTPSGQINVQTINRSAADAFIPGKDYYVDFEIAEG